MATPKKRKTKQKDIQLEELQNIEDVLNDLPDSPIPKQLRHLSDQKKEEFIRNLRRVLAEYMDCYMLVGFSVDGLETIVVETHGTPLETRGLNDLSIDFFNNYFGSQGMQMGDFDDDDM